MKLRAANERREEALWGVFLMFVVMALVIVRTGVVCRGLAAVVPLEDAPQDAPSSIDGRPSSASPEDLYQAVLVVLYLAEAAGQLFIQMTREDWELINEPPCRPAPERRRAVAGLCERSTQRLDTS